MIIEPIYIAIGQEIKKQREALGLSMDDIGGPIGCSRAVVYNWETGKARISFHHLIALTYKLDMDLNKYKSWYKPAEWKAPA